MLSNLIVIPTLTLHASSGPFDSGYHHGCNDAEILEPSERYINQAEKGPSFHTDEFMQGYYDGFDACTSSTELMSSPEAETFKIDATIDFDRQAILGANGNNLGDAWFTINGQRYGEGSYYDMIDRVYDDDVEIRGINTNSLYRVIELPYFVGSRSGHSGMSKMMIEVIMSVKTVINSDEKSPEKSKIYY